MIKKFKIKAKGGLLITLLLINTLWCIGNQTNSMAKQPKPKVPAKNADPFKTDSANFVKSVDSLASTLKRQLRSNNDDSIDSARVTAQKLNSEYLRIKAKYPGKKIL